MITTTLDQALVYMQQLLAEMLHEITTPVPKMLKYVLCFANFNAVQSAIEQR
jgi:hypothetical protein